MNSIYRIKKIMTLCMLAIFFIPAFVPLYAQTQNDAYDLIPCSGVNGKDDPGTKNGHECTFEDLIRLAQAVAKKIVQIGLILSPIIFAYAGYLLITSSDNPGKRDTAKKIAWNVAKGIAVMMLAWLIVDLILRALLKQGVLNNLPWGK